MSTAETPGTEDLADQIEGRVAALLDQAIAFCERHGAALPSPVCRFDLRGQCAGRARSQTGRPPELRFNLRMAAARPDVFLKETVAHEVAHLIAMACFGHRIAPHGPQWRLVMQHFGIHEPRRCHDYDIAESDIRRQKRWTYTCACRLHELTTTRHNRVRGGRARYVCRHCGQTLQPSRTGHVQKLPSAATEEH